MNNEEDYDRIFAGLLQDLDEKDIDPSIMENLIMQIAQSLSVLLEADDADIAKFNDFAKTYWDLVESSLSTKEIKGDSLTDIAKSSMYFDSILWAVFSEKVPSRVKFRLIKVLSNNFLLLARATYSRGHRDGYLQSRMDQDISSWDLGFLDNYKGENDPTSQ